MRFSAGLLAFLLLSFGHCWGQGTLNVPRASYPTIQSAINAVAQGGKVLSKVVGRTSKLRSGESVGENLLG